ncbi:MAG: Fic family protein [Chloroflexales bacterium]|jgi:Fic family protein
MVPTIDRRLLERIQAKRHRLDTFRPMHPILVRRLHDDMRLLLTYHSNAIEGNTLSLAETQMVLEHGITVGGKTLREHLEATNHAEAFTLISDLRDDAEPITVALILRVHQVVMDKIIPDAGMLRSIPVHIRGASVTPPHPRDVPDYLRQWLAWIDSAEALAYHPVVRAAIAHHGFEAVHPFSDGNGRVGRLLLNLMLMRSGYPPALILREWRLGYIHALEAANTGDYRGILTVTGRAVEHGLDLYLESCEAEPEAAYQSLADLAAQTEYAADYLGWLIRKGRLPAIKRSGRWQTTLVAVSRYRDEVAQGVYPPGRPGRTAG